MSAESQRTCPNCGNEFSGTMEFCPACMLRQGLGGGVKSGESSAVKPATSEQVALLFEHYELVTGEDGKPVELGRGAMGVTYKALDINLRCPVTLKVIGERYLGDESARLRFLREARAAASVRHPNVASVFHLGRTGQNYFYAMEFVEGETLESLIRHSGQLAVKLALEIATQVAAGLGAVHKQKLVHRDIKPSNIMVSLEEGGAITAKIIDLGLAKPVNEPGSQTGISMPGGFAGTPEFASPEQFAGVGVDIRSDLYSLGVTLWATVTGRTPFRGPSAEVMYQHQHAPLPLEQLKAVPQPILVLFEKLLEKDPAQRFQTPDELLKTIPTITGAIEARRRITRQSPQKAPFSTLRVRTRKPPTRPAPKKRDKERLAHRDQSREILVSSAPNPVSNFPMTLFAALVVTIGLIWFASHGGRKTALPTPTPILESTPKPTPQSTPTPAPESTPRLTPKSSPARTTESAPTPMPIPAWIAPSWTPESKPRLTPTPTSSDPAFYTNRGFEAFKESDYDGAIRDFTEAIRLDPKDVEAYHGRGVCYRHQGKKTQAQADFDKAKQLGYTGSQ